jgi:ribose transport system ATP-binding protein
VEIAKALSFKSRVLIMDEPTAALNNAEIDELFRIIRQLKSEGVGIVYISHKMDEIQRIADRITVMRDGTYINTVPAATPMQQVIAMMVGRNLEVVQKSIPDTSANEVLLEVRGLNRGRAIRDVNFQVRRGEIVGFAGLMGAGRTEVARAVFGADPIDSGEVRVRGQAIRLRSPEDGVQAGIGYLSEDRKHFGLATGMDVASNITLPSLRRWLKWGVFLNQSAIRNISLQMVEKLRIKTPSISQTAKLLSGGNQQKVVIAKWLVQDCEILIFDEPTRGIDVGAKSEIYKLLNELAAQGRAIVVISSELPEVLLLSHRVLVMCEGRITGEVRGDEATQESLMALATRRESDSSKTSAQAVLH